MFHVIALAKYEGPKFFLNQKHCSLQSCMSLDQSTDYRGTNFENKITEPPETKIRAKGYRKVDKFWHTNEAIILRIKTFKIKQKT